MGARSIRMRWTLLAVLAVATSGCFDSSPGDLGDGGNDAAGSNARPTISGTPPRAVKVGERYSFTPAATDPNGDALRFSIASRPAWLAFDGTTGRLSGTASAADIGSFGGIVITVSDGRSSADLGPFTIDVTQYATGSVTLSWSPPTTNTDGSALTNLAGYRIYFGKSPASLDESITIGSPGITRYVVDNLSPATWFFAMTSFTSSGSESVRSVVRSKAVG